MTDQQHPVGRIEFRDPHYNPKDPSYPLAQENRRLRAKLEEAEATLLRILPECFVCPECGPLVKADEDGCCVHCGADCDMVPTRAVMALAKESE